MARTKKEETKIASVEVKIIPLEEVKVEVPKVAPLTLEFGRQDLNQLRDKINEVIEKLC